MPEQKEAQDATPTAPTRSVRIDYVTLSFDRLQLDAVIEWATNRFGRPKKGKGMYLLRSSQRYEDGRCVVLFDPPDDNCKPYAVVSVPGAGCKRLGDSDLLLSVQEMRSQIGAKLTRIDIAVDHLESTFPLSLYELRTKAHTSGELCGARVADYREKFTVGTGVSRGETLNIGKRGKDGSGRSVCVYDKGLESGTESEAGRWVRWEARFSDDCAEKAFEAYQDAPDPIEKMKIAYDAVEFRQDISARLVTDRPYADWWVELREGSTPANVIKRTRKDSNSAKCLMWLDNAVAPMLHYIKDRTGLGWDDLMSMMGVGQDASYTPKNHVLELIEELQSGASDDDGNPLPDIYSMLFNQTIKETA